jgi:caffeoyl-CoA O-methyltransferase
MPSICTDATDEYLASMAPPADDLVAEMEAHAAEMEAHAAEDDIPIADRSVAGLQMILACATDADRALEFGTAIGYSTLHIARTGTDVVTTEVDRARINAAVDYLRRGGIEVRVTDDPATVTPEPTGEGSVVIVEEPALETISELEGWFDLAFLDAVKQEYEDYLAGALPLLPEGGVVVADNLLRRGTVPADAADVEERWAESAAALRTFNETFVGHEQLYAIITPQGDGTGIGMKTG